MAPSYDLAKDLRINYSVTQKITHERHRVDLSRSIALKDLYLIFLLSFIC